MPEKKIVVPFPNEILQEMSGIELGIDGIPDKREMNESERLLFRMEAMRFLLSYTANGKHAEDYLQQSNEKKDKLPPSWWEQFHRISETAASQYSKHTRYFVASNQFIGQENDEVLVNTGDPNAIRRFNLSSLCALLMSALHPEADHPFFKSSVGDMPEYITKGEYPVFTPSPELTDEEWKQVEQICKGALEIYRQDVNRDETEIITYYVINAYGNDIVANDANIPRLNSITPHKHIIPNNKITNELSAGRITFSDNIEDFFNIRVSKENAKNPIISTIMVAYDGDNVQISGRRPFTEYDRNVYNAVVSLYVNGDPQHVMTPAMIYRAMTGLSEASNPSPQQIGAVTKSLDKMRFTRVRIDCTEELKMRRAQLNSVPIVNGMVDTYLLNADGAQVTAGGRVVEAYRVNQPPVLYEYSRATKQVLTVPSDLLAIKEADNKGVYNNFISNNESRIQVKGYLLRRIEGMKGKNALNNNIISLQSYEKNGKHHPGLYEIAGKPTPTTKESTNIRSYISSVLNFWKAEKYIKDFKFCKTGKSITGVKVTV